jgi:putative ABC transport system permease protein
MSPVYVELPAAAHTRRGIVALLAGALALGAALVGLVAGVPKPIVCALICAPFVAVLLGRPTLRRMAVRNAARRPAESALVVLGALLGTAIITSGFIVQDSLAASVTQRAYTQLGPVDEVVRSSGSASGSAVARAVAAQPHIAIGGSVPMLAISAPVLNTSTVPAAEPHAQLLEIDFAQGRQFGGNPSRTGLSGATPGPGEAVLGADLAKTLSVRPGDTVVAAVYGQRASLRVNRILPRTGLAGFWLGQGSTSPNIFVAPGTIDGLRAHAPVAIGTPAPAVPTSILAVTNGGSVLQSRGRSDSVATELRAAVAGQPATVATVKSDLLDAAKVAAQSSTSLLHVAADLSVFAGILLLINTFVMLAQERKVSLGMLRAIGLRRSGVVAAFALEGWFYAMVSAVLGVIAGVGLGRLVIVASSTQFAARSQGASSSVQFAVSSASLQSGLTVGLAIAVGTAVATAAWIARTNVIRAVRDLPEPAAGRPSRVRTVLNAAAASCGLAVLAAGLASQNASLLLAGPALLAAGTHRLLARVIPPSVTGTIASIAVVVWGIAASSIVPAPFTNAGTSVYLLQAVVLAGAGVALFGIHQGGLATALRRVGGSRGLPFRLGLAYPLARKSRTALVLAIFVLEVMTLAVTLGLGNVPGGQITRSTTQLASGASLRVASDVSNPVPVTAVRALPGVTRVTGLSTATVDVAAGPGAPSAGTTQIAGSDQTVFGHGAPLLGQRAAGYSTDGAAYAAVQANPDLIIVNKKFLEHVAHPIPGTPRLGQHVSLRNPATGAGHQVTIIGIEADVPVDQNLVDFVARPVVTQLAGADVPTNLLFVATGRGVNPDHLASVVNGQFASNGADAMSFRQSAASALASRQQFLQLLGGFVAVGLLIGVIALGVVMVRAVRERRRDIGTLRALGLSRRGVRRAFLAEAGFVAVQGTLIGAALGTVFAWRLSTGTSASVFVVPWPALAAMVAVTVVAALLAAIRPANQASRIPPAVALRTTD